MKEISILILITSIVINIGMFFKYYEKNQPLIGDTLQYDNIALSILSGKSTYSYVPGGTEYDIGDVLMPGYSFLLAIIYFLFGHNYLSVYIFQVILSILAAQFFFKIMERYIKSLTAFISTIWLILYYPLWGYSFLLLKESLSASILIISLYYIDVYFQKNKNKYLYISALAFGIHISIDNRYILHFIFFIFFLFYLYIKRNVNNIRFKAIIICTAIVLTILLPWHIRQYIIYDRLVLFGAAYTDAAMGNKKIVRPFCSYEEYLNQILNGRSNEEGKEYFKKHFTREKFEEMKKNYNDFSGFNKYLSRFLGFWEIYNNKIHFGYGGYTEIVVPSSTIRKYTDLIFLAPMLVLFLIGYGFSLIKRNKYFKLIGILIFAHILLITYVHYAPRHRLTIIPLMFMLGWYGIDQIINVIDKYRNKEAVINQQIA